MLSDIENLVVMLGENDISETEREECLNSNLTRRSESTASDNFENANEEMYLNRNLGVNAEYGQSSASGNSNAEINRLSSELNSRLSRE